MADQGRANDMGKRRGGQVSEFSGNEIGHGDELFDAAVAASAGSRFLKCAGFEAVEDAGEVGGERSGQALEGIESTAPGPAEPAFGMREVLGGAGLKRTAPIHADMLDRLRLTAMHGQVLGEPLHAGLVPAGGGCLPPSALRKRWRGYDDAHPPTPFPHETT